jgi:sugar diacid utilization regulator
VELTVTDLLQLPILREAKVLTEGSYDPYRPVAARCIDPQVGPGIFCEAELDAILASLVDEDAWPALCVVSPDTDAPPADERFGVVLDRASARGAALLWLHSKEPTEDLHLRFYQELLEYHEVEVEESRRIQRRLNEIVVAGGTLHEICRELAVLTQNPVSIKTAYHEVVAFYDIGNPDSARRRTNAAGSVPDDILQALHTAGLPGRLQSEVGAFRFGPLPEIDYQSRVMASIRTESAVWGYISIAECTHELGLLDLSAVESAANCAALIVWKTRALEQRAREQQTRFIGDLLFAEQEPETFSARAHLLGYDPAERYQAVVLQWTNSADEVRTPHLGNRRHEVARTVDSFLATSGARALVYSIPVGDRVVCLWPATAGDPTRIGPGLLERLSEAMPLEGLRAGVGSAGGPPDPLANSYRQAQVALQLSPVDDAVCTYRGLGVARLVADHLVGEAGRAFAEEYLGALEEYDQDHQRELLHTLDAYYRSGQNPARAAETLYVHLNTVKYRLKRIQELTGHDPGDPGTGLDFQMALLIRRLDRRP